MRAGLCAIHDVTITLHMHEEDEGLRVMLRPKYLKKLAYQGFFFPTKPYHSGDVIFLFLFCVCECVCHSVLCVCVIINVVE